MIKRLAEWVLHNELCDKDAYLGKVNSLRQAAEERVKELEQALDTSRSSYMYGVDIITSKDLALKPEHKTWLKEQYELGTLSTILDILLVNVITGLARNPQEPTANDAKKIHHFRMAYLVLMAEAQQAAGKEITADPLTGEVKS